jgi:hypothetical protein
VRVEGPVLPDGELCKADAEEAAEYGLRYRVPGPVRHGLVRRPEPEHARRHRSSSLWARHCATITVVITSSSAMAAGMEAITVP